MVHSPSLHIMYRGTPPLVVLNDATTPGALTKSIFRLSNIIDSYIFIIFKYY